MEAGVAPRVAFLVGVLVAVSLGQGVVVAEGEGVEVEVGVWPEPRPGIFIDSDVGLTGFILGHDPVTGEPIHNLAQGVRSGSGTAEDPYVISNWQIVTHRPAAIRIEGTHAHATIRNILHVGQENSIAALADCVVGECSNANGVEVVNASNVTIQRARVLHAESAILVSGSQFVRIESAHLGVHGLPPFVDSLFRGVNVQSSDHVEAENITVVGSFSPIVVDESTNVNFRNSTFIGSSGTDTIPVRDGDAIEFLQSWFKHTQILTSIGLTNFSLVESTLTGGRDPVATSSNTKPYADFHFCGNTFESTNGVTAIYLESVTRAQILKNSFEGNAGGLEIQLATDVLVEGNAIRNSSFWGAILNVPSDGVVHNNSFEGNARGISITRDNDARFNWWADPSGPSGDGPGSGEKLSTQGGGVIFDPWLTSPPALDFDCVPGESRGAQTLYEPAVAVAVDAQIAAHASQHVGPLHFGRAADL